MIADTWLMATRLGDGAINRSSLIELVNSNFDSDSRTYPQLHGR